MYGLLLKFIKQFKSILFILFIFTSLHLTALPLNADTLTVNISSGNDDAEDKGGTSNVTDDPVLNIGEATISSGDGAGYIGLRFQNITIPRGSIITNA